MSLTALVSNAQLVIPIDISELLQEPDLFEACRIIIDFRPYLTKLCGPMWSSHGLSTYRVREQISRMATSKDLSGSGAICSPPNRPVQSVLSNDLSTKTSDENEESTANRLRSPR